MRKIKKIKQRCCCCGKFFYASYEEGDEVGKAFAEVADVCPECVKADCRVLTGDICNVTGEKQYQLKKED